MLDPKNTGTWGVNGTIFGEHKLFRQCVCGLGHPTHISNILKDTRQPILIRFLGKTSNMVCNKVTKSLDYIIFMLYKMQKIDEWGPI